MNSRVAFVNVESFLAMREEAIDKQPNETGGCLIGYHLIKNNALVVATVIGPGPKAVHKINSFKPDDTWQRKTISKIYGASGRVFTYLGDWHVHSFPSEIMSNKDKKTLQRIANYPPARSKNPIMGIMYFDQDWKLAVWQLKKQGSSYFTDNSVYEKLVINIY